MRRATGRPPIRRPHARRRGPDRRSWPAASRDPALLSCFLLLAALRGIPGGRRLRGCRVISGAGAATLYAAMVCGKQATNLLRRPPVGRGGGLLHAARYEL